MAPDVPRLPALRIATELHAPARAPITGSVRRPAFDGTAMICSIARRPRLGAAFLLGLSAFAPLALTTPARALDTTLENVVVDNADKGSFRIARIEIVGANLTQDELAKLFAPATSVDERRALAARLKADRIAIPEAVLTNKDSRITISNVAATGIADGKVARAGFASIDGTAKTDAGDTVTLKSGALTVEGADVSAFLGTGGAAAFSRFSWDNVAVMAPDTTTPASAPGGNLVSVNIASLSADATFDGPVALKSAATVKGLVIQLPPASPAAQQLTAFGYDKLDLGVVYAGVYDPAAKTYALDELSVTGAGAGTLRLKSMFGGVDKAAFSGAAMERMMALMQGKVSAVDIGFADAGLTAKAIAFFAKMQQKPPAALQAEAAAMAGQIIPAVLGGAPKAPAIAAAVQSFITSPGAITILMRPKAGPLAFGEIMQITDPPSFLAKVDLDVQTAAATGAAPAPAAPAPAASAAAPPQAVASAPAAAPPAAPAAPRQLAGLDAWNALLGNTVTGKNDDDEVIFEFYTKDGVVKQLNDDEITTGKWSFKNGQVCFEYPDDDDPSCYKLVVDGTTATFTDEDGTGLRYQILPGNPKKL